MSKRSTLPLALVLMAAFVAYGFAVIRISNPLAAAVASHLKGLIQ